MSLPSIRKFLLISLLSYQGAVFGFSDPQYEQMVNTHSNDLDSLCRMYSDVSEIVAHEKSNDTGLEQAIDSFIAVLPLSNEYQALNHSYQEKYKELLILMYTSAWNQNNQEKERLCDRP